jgi:hypothetical protein
LGGGKYRPPTPILFLPKNNFLGCRVEEGQIKNWGENGRKGCMHIKDWFKPNFHFLLALLLRKLKFLIHMVDSPTPCF